MTSDYRVGDRVRELETGDEGVVDALHPEGATEVFVAWERDSRGILKGFVPGFRAWVSFAEIEHARVMCPNCKTAFAKRVFEWFCSEMCRADENGPGRLRTPHPLPREEK